MPSQRARERSKEEIDGVVLRAILGTPAQVQVAVDQLHLLVGRDDVDAIGHDARAFGRFDHRQRRMPGEQRRKRAGVIRRQVLHEDQREIRIGRQPLEQLCKGLEPSCRRAYSDDGEVRCWFRRSWKG